MTAFESEASLSEERHSLYNDYTEESTGVIRYYVHQVDKVGRQLNVPRDIRVNLE